MTKADASSSMSAAVCANSARRVVSCVMTNSERLQTELEHLLRLVDPPLQAWLDFVDRKAEALAKMHPDVYQALPEMLRAAMQQSLNQPGRERPSTDRKEN